MYTSSAGLKTAADSLSLHSKLLTFATRLQAVVAVAPPSWMRPTRSSATLSAAVLQKPALVEHALRQTLAADALSLQLKLPPAGVPLPMAQTSPDLAGGTAVVDIVAVTSVWVVQVLRALCMVRHSSKWGAWYWLGCLSLAGVLGACARLRCLLSSGVWSFAGVFTITKRLYRNICASLAC